MHDDALEVEVARKANSQLQKTLWFPHGWDIRRYCCTTVSLETGC